MKRRDDVVTKSARAGRYLAVLALLSASGACTRNGSKGPQDPDDKAGEKALPDLTQFGGSLHGSWIELYTHLLDRHDSDADLPTDDVAARESICPGGACTLAGPWLIEFDDGVVIAQYVGLARDDGSIVLSPLLAQSVLGEECGGSRAKIDVLNEGGAVFAEMLSTLGVRGLTCTPGNDDGCTKHEDCDADPELAGCDDGCRESSAQCTLPLDPQTLAPAEADGECSAYARLTTADGDDAGEAGEPAEPAESDM